MHLVLGLIGLLVGSEVAVRGSIQLARRWGWPSWLTGVLLLALGTSLPELFVSGRAAAAHPLLACGNVLGSNAFNIGAVLGIVLLMRGREGLPAAALQSAAMAPLVLGTLLMMLLLVPSLAWKLIGAALFAGYGWLLWRILRDQRRKKSGSAAQVEAVEAIEAIDAATPDDGGAVSLPPLAWSLLVTLAGFATLAFGSDFFLTGALALAAELGWSEGFAGYLITAVGTSAPELITSVRAVRHGHAEAVLGNVVGSNAFNTLMVGGAVGFLGGPVADAGLLLPQLLINAAALSLLAAPIAVPLLRRGERDSLVGWWGAPLVAGYLVAAWLVA